MKKILALTALLLALTAQGAGRAELKMNKPGAAISPTMYGIFFEDINFGADGGLYAEKIINRSFEFPNSLQGWKTFGTVKVMDEGGPFERNPHYVRLLPAGHGEKHTGIENEGFFGVTFEKDSLYRFSAWMRVPDGKSQKVRVELCDPASAYDSQVFANKDIEVSTAEWARYTVELKPWAGAKRGVLRLYLAKPDANPVDVEHVSLFPTNTWKGHENGLRADLAQALYDLNPGVFRFPGGCIVEGTELPDRYQWKNTVGPVENRPLNLNRWLYTFPWRLFPDYYQSGGLGFYEYFLLSEEIGAEPLPVLNVGLVCQYQNNDLKAHQPADELKEFIDDAVDLIEFANGDTTTTWGALRAEMGHPAPFNLKYMAIGNEQWGPEYVEHLEPFLKVLREKHPEIKIIGSSGPDSEGDKFDYLWPEMRRVGADLVDEHFYRPEDWFLSQGTRYDNYDRKGPKVFAGEYACHPRGKKYNHFFPALLEAAFMTGLDRNADVVEMATYAPLFAHVEGWQWRPDMIWFDNNRMMKSSSYYVQQLYGHNTGTRVLPLTLDGRPIAGLEGQDGLFASAVLDEPSGDLIIKIANTGRTAAVLPVDIKGLKEKNAYTKLTMSRLQSDDPDAENTLDDPERVKPAVTESTVDVSKEWTAELPPLTFTVYRFSR